MTGMFAAAGAGHEHIVRMLLQRGSLLDVGAFLFNVTALHTSVSMNHVGAPRGGCRISRFSTPVRYESWQRRTCFPFSKTCAGWRWATLRETKIPDEWPP